MHLCRKAIFRKSEIVTNLYVVRLKLVKKKKKGGEKKKKGDFFKNQEGRKEVNTN